MEPADYPPGRTRTNPDNRPSTVEDICEFIGAYLICLSTNSAPDVYLQVEYINSDVLVSDSSFDVDLDALRLCDHLRVSYRIGISPFQVRRAYYQLFATVLTFIIF